MKNKKLNYSLIILLFLLIFSACQKQDSVETVKEYDFSKLFMDASRISLSRENIDSLNIISNYVIDTINEKKLSQEDDFATALKFKGIYSFLNRDFDRAIELYSQAEEIFSKTSNFKELFFIFNNMGVLEMQRNDFEKALRFFIKAADISEKQLNNERLEIVNLNIGNIYINLNNHETAYGYFLKSLEYAKKKSNIIVKINALNNLTITLNYLSLYEDAITYAYRAENLAKEYNMNYYLGSIYNNLATVFESLENYEQSLRYYKESLEYRYIDDEDILKTLNNIISIYVIMKDLQNAENYLNIALKIANENQVELTSIANIYTVADFYYNAGDFSKASTLYRTILYNSRPGFDKELHNQVAELQIKYEAKRKDNKIILLQKDAEINNLRFLQQRRFIITLGVFALFSVIALYVIYRLYTEKMKDNVLLNRERDFSEKLLLNTLPEKVVAEIRSKGEFKPEVFYNCSVIFADIVNFTKISESLSPKDLIFELNDIFTAFDNIFSKYQCERIKTNGDAYIGVCGLPDFVFDNCDKIINAAVEMKDYLLEKSKKSEIKWDVRIGLHTGTVIAAITGVKKYVFDIFGDTVNITARIQNVAEPNEIIVSEAFFMKLKTKYLFKSKMQVNIKGKGDYPVYVMIKDV